MLPTAKSPEPSWKRRSLLFFGSDMNISLLLARWPGYDRLSSHWCQPQWHLHPQHVARMLQGLQASNKGWCSCYWSVQQKVHLRASAIWQGQYFSSWSFNAGAGTFSMATSAWSNASSSLRLKGSWTLDSFPRGQSIINFPVQVATTQTRESCTAEAKQIFDRKCLKLHMSQQHAKGMSVLGKFVPSKNCAHYCFFPWDTQIFPFQNSGQLTCNKLPQIWMLAANLKLFSNLFSQASLKEWRPCVSCRTCRATLQSKQVQSKQARMITDASISPASFGRL